MSLLAGVATVDITPPIGTWMAGFASRDKPAQGIHDALQGKALVLSDGTTTVCLVTMDVVGLGNDLTARIRDEVGAATGIPAANVMVNYSHTHSGPQGRDADYIDVTVRKVAGAAKMAQDALAPAKLGYARTAVQVGVNRREMRDGQMLLGEDWDKPVAPYVDVLRVDRPDGSPLVVLFAHACHAVTMASDNYLISADYPGQAKAVVETVHPGATAMFAQGCAGNVNSVPVGGTFEDVRRIGTTLAGAVIHARELARTSDDLRLGVAWREFALPCMAEGDAPPQLIPFNLQAIRIGDLAIIGLPGEVFVEYALNGEAASPFGSTIVLGYTGGGGYVPTAAEIPLGGYEVTDVAKYSGRQPISPEAEPLLNAAVAGLLGELHSQG